MNTTQIRIMEAIIEVFPEAEGLSFSEDFTLGDLPDWDSMASVNLQTCLQHQFDIEVPLELLADETTILQLAMFLEDSAKCEAV